MNTEIATLVYPIFRDRTLTPNKGRYYRFAIGSTVNSCPALPHGAAAQPDAIILFSYTVTSAQGLPVVTHMMLPYSRHRDLMDSYREHEAVVEALRRGDSAAALECLGANIQ